MLLEGKSSLVVLPDFAELYKFEAALANQDLSNVSVRHSSSDSGSQRYSNHLASINNVSINYGLRSAAFSPATNLGLILLWDDGDESHIEQSSPYWNSREVLLQRAELEKAKIVLSSHSPSAEAVRLVEIKHLVHVSSKRESLDVLITSLTDRLDSQTFALISNSLKAGRPVLVQIANAGWASGLVCVGCRELRICPNCSASIWIDPSGQIRCRSCKLHLESSPCSCGKTATRPTKIGASGFTKQMERSFPNASVVHSNGEQRLLSIKSGPLLVVSTPGAEPEVEGGYACVVIADAPSMVGSPRLRALEQSLGRWANAVSLASTDSTIVFAGLVGELAEHMSKLDFYSAVMEDFADRQDLGLPPITRIASVVSSNSTDHQRLIERLRTDLHSEKVRTLGVTQPNTLVFDYSYSVGQELAELLKDSTQKLSATSKTKKPGERVYRINMDDGKVI
jgi:primosomal protein N' (replication factor Y)